MNTRLIILSLICWSFSAQAHKPSDSYLALHVAEQRVAVQWDIALRDLDYALGLDMNNDGNITWGELQQRQAAVNAYVLPRLSINNEQYSCPLQATELLVDEHSDGHYAVLKFQSLCPTAPKTLSVAYHLFFDIDAQHRGLLTLTRGARIDSAIFSPAKSTIDFSQIKPRSAWAELQSFALEGIWHIWIGYDHILFLLSLLLPAAMVRVGKQWQSGLGFSAAFWEVFKVVGAFTVAHSITLSLAVFGYVSLPSRWVESAIAASVAIAALNNIFPVFTKRRSLLAFGFGLIHGLGIASVLLDMNLPASQCLLSLLGFNVGVEIGQLAIVSVALPLISYFSQSRFYTPVVLKSGSAGITAIALFWLAERSLDVQFNLF
jgi:hypothetical protein